MQIEITLKNYRCFADSKPARFVMRKGLTGFLGANNSGKSTLLKFFYELRPLFQKLSAPAGLGTQDDLVRAFRGGPVGFPQALPISDPEEIFCNTNQRDLEIDFHFSYPETRPSPQPVERILVKVQRATGNWTGQLHLADGLVKPDRTLYLDSTTVYFDNNAVGSYAEPCIAFAALAKSLYLPAFRNAINVGATQAYFDTQVGQAFIRAWRAYKTGFSKKQNEAAYKLTEDIKKIFEFSDLEINSSENDQTLQVFVNGKSYKLLELGAGLAQFIVVLASAAVKEPSYILIDEPELNLHPPLQLDFLTTLVSYASEGTLFATHNVGLARAAADWIYSVRRTGEGQSELREFEATPRLSEFLGELSFSGYRELGFEKVLLVEGVTDVKTVHQFLRFYNKDHKVVVLQLGGVQLINPKRELELEEVKRISSHVFALIDSERTAAGNPIDPNRTGFLEMCQRAGVQCLVLERRAIENYFPDRAVKRVMGEKYRALGPYVALRDASPAWPKSDNWRIAREMRMEELERTDLGEFLRRI